MITIFFVETIDKLLNAKRLKPRDSSQKLETKLKDWSSSLIVIGISDYGSDRIPSWDWDNKDKYSMATDFYSYMFRE